MNIITLIEKKKNKEALTEKEIEYIIQGYMKNKITDYQMSAFLMAVCLKGMTKKETIYLTASMLNSGKILDLKQIPGIKVDKHSTGGIGDKTTLIITPLVAACGVVVPKISGRGLGYTGGTIDKLEAIKGINVNLKEESFLKQLKEIKVGITSTTKDLAPADSKIYALRDVTATVASIPLIATSIMSKKLAVNSDKIVLDVKVGSGTFIKTKEEALTLAKLMIEIGNSFQKEIVAVISNMDTPLGSNIGNSLEVMEVLEILEGKKKNNLTKLALTLASYMVSLGKEITYDEAKEEVKEALVTKKALKKFKEMIHYQLGDLKELPLAKIKTEIKSKEEGYLNQIKALIIGEEVMNLGAGRKTKEDKIDYGVGLILKKELGDYVKKGDVLTEVYSNNSLINKERLEEAFLIEKEKKEIKPLIIEVIKNNS
ncbi:MAG: thymidine phosphorylase [Bacilli bacterium]|jgi:pyrimidine-nucleoside phosphorylase